LAGSVSPCDNALVAKELKKHQEAVLRIAKMPGFGVDSAQQIIAEIGVDASGFPSAAQFCSWAGTSPITAERRTEPQLAVAQREPLCAAHPDSSGASGGEEEG
jgi:hypothetical protein